MDNNLINHIKEKIERAILEESGFKILAIPGDGKYYDLSFLLIPDGMNSECRTYLAGVENIMQCFKRSIPQFQFIAALDENNNLVYEVAGGYIDLEVET